MTVGRRRRRRFRTLSESLADLEASDPEVARAARAVDDVENYLLGRPSALGAHERSLDRMERARSEWRSKRESDDS